MSATADQPRFHDQAPERPAFLAAVLAGLSRRRKALPCKYFYDEHGSRLFERICELPEYYPTRTETALLAAHRAEIAAALGPHCLLVDFGAGSSAKARILLEALDRPLAYVPVDISREHLRRSAAAIARDHRHLQVTALCADYTRPFRLPDLPPPFPRRPVGFFPGSTIGNFTPAQARRFLAAARRALAGGPMLVGVDLKKPEPLLHAAYNDAAGVTAAFNRNLLVRINRELGANFVPERFAHHAFYHRRRGRIEMHLRSLGEQVVMVGPRAFRFTDGETIHTENSHKFAVHEFSAVAEVAGFPVDRVWTDPQGLFALFLLQA